LGVPSYAWVPFWGLYGSGLMVALGTDNPGFMNTTIEDEYARLYLAFQERLIVEKAFPDGPGPLYRRYEQGRTDTREQSSTANARVAALWRKIEMKTRSLTAQCAGFGDYYLL